VLKKTYSHRKWNCQLFCNWITEEKYRPQNRTKKGECQWGDSKRKPPVLLGAACRVSQVKKLAKLEKGPERPPKHTSLLNF
jgi:hypothetical protein